jgi:precorrin-2 methylase
MKDRPAMTKDEIEELIHDLSANIGIAEALADDLLDAGHFISWAAHENDLDEEEAQEELEDISEDLTEFIRDELDEGKDVEMVALGMWYHIQNIEEKLREEAPKEEVDDEKEPRDVMFR